MKRAQRPDPLGGLTGLREQIVRQYAKTGPSGHPSRCIDQPAPRKQKVIFPTEQAAAACARELNERAEALALWPYRCPVRPHWHLTKQRGES